MNVMSKSLSLQIPIARTFDEAAQNLITLGFTRLESNLPKRFEAVVLPFAKLTEDPDGELLKIDADREKHEDGTADLGLRIARKGDIKLNPRPDEIAEGRTNYDETKFIYHGNDRALGYFAERPDLIRRHRNFFFESTLLHNECNILALEVADRLDVHLPGFAFAKRMLKVQALSRLRLLRYLCDGTSPAIAQRHRDQCFLTIHIKSDRAGLWLADRNNENIIIDVQETRDDSVLLFFGRKAWELTYGQLKGVLHGVTDPAYGLNDRAPRHTGVDFQHVDVPEPALDWSAKNMDQLQIPHHIAMHGLVKAA